MKLIIFASYWQGFALAILLYFNVIPQVGHYTPDNLARAIQDLIICFEMPMFALAHWYAFSYKDFQSPPGSASRMPVWAALRDSAGTKDLWCDILIAMDGDSYGYQQFESHDVGHIHREGGPRMSRLRDGLRYEKGGTKKYWISMPEASSRVPLLRPAGISPQRGLQSNGYGSTRPYVGTSSQNSKLNYGFWAADDPLEIEMDPKDERYYDDARELEYGDYNVSVYYAIRLF